MMKTNSRHAQIKPATAGLWHLAAALLLLCPPPLHADERTIVIFKDGQPLPSPTFSLPPGDTLNLLAQVRLNGDYSTQSDSLHWTVSGDLALRHEPDGSVTLSGIPRISAAEGPLTSSGQVTLFVTPKSPDELLPPPLTFSVQVLPPPVSLELRHQGSLLADGDTLRLTKNLAALLSAGIFVDGKEVGPDSLLVTWTLGNQSWIAPSTPSGHELRRHQIQLLPLLTDIFSHLTTLRVQAAGITYQFPIKILPLPVVLSLDAPQERTLFLHRQTPDEQPLRVSLSLNNAPLNLNPPPELLWHVENPSILALLNPNNDKTSRHLLALDTGFTHVFVSLPPDGDGSTPPLFSFSIRVPAPVVDLYIGQPAASDSTKELPVHSTLFCSTSLFIDTLRLDTAQIRWNLSSSGILSENYSGNNASFSPLRINTALTLTASAYVEGQWLTSRNRFSVNIPTPPIAFKIGADTLPAGATFRDTVRIAQAGKLLTFDVLFDKLPPDPVFHQVEWHSWDTTAIRLTSTPSTPSRLGARDTAHLSILRCPEHDTVLLSARIAGTHDSLLYILHVERPPLHIAASALSAQIEDTVFFKATTAYPATPPMEDSYTWKSLSRDTLLLLPYPNRTDTFALLPTAASPTVSATLAVYSALGGRDTFRLKVIPPTLTLTPPLPEGDTVQLLEPLRTADLFFTATTTPPPASEVTPRPLSMAIRAAARWFSEDSAKVYVNAAGQLFSRDTGSVTITLGLAGATVSRRVRVPAPSLVFSLSAATDTLRLATPLTLTSRLHLNGWLVNFDELADHAMVDSLTPRWTSLDTVTILPPVQVSPAGLVSFSPERLRTTIDSVRISARVKAFGVTAQDTLLFYLPAVAPTPPDAILHALPDDLLLPGQTIEIFSIDGKPVRTLRPHRLYLIRTPRGVTKLQLRE